MKRISSLQKFLCTSIILIWIFSFGIQSVYSQEKPEINVGGALRFNYNLSSWKDGQKERGGDFGYDMFRVNFDAAWKDIYLNAEYRLYSEAFGGGFLKQGWVGYRFNDKEEIQVGLSQVPFGIQQYNSHNWFFNLTYYFGLEDDHDMGVKYLHVDDKFEYDLAFYKNAEELRFGGDSEGWDLKGYKPPAKSSVNEILEDLKNNASMAEKALQKPDEVYGEIWKMTERETVLMEMPRFNVLQSIVMNQFPHHRAQLGVYFRLLDISVPSTYGPSADEQ